MIDIIRLRQARQSMLSELSWGIQSFGLYHLIPPEQGMVFLGWRGERACGCIVNRSQSTYWWSRIQRIHLTSISYALESEFNHAIKAARRSPAEGVKMSSQLTPLDSRKLKGLLKPKMVQSLIDLFPPHLYELPKCNDWIGLFTFSSASIH